MSRLQGLSSRYGLLVATIILAAGLRVFGIAEHGLRPDERASVSIAVGSILTNPIVTSDGLFTPGDFWSGNTLHNVIEATIAQAAGNQLVFNVLLHYWMQLLGTQDLIVRLFSAVFGTFVVLLVYQIALLLCSKRVACVAGVLAAVHPLLVHSSQEARAFAFATCSSLLATLVFINLIGFDRFKTARVGNWFVYALAVAVSVLSHHLTVYVFLGHVLIAALRVRERRAWFDLVKGVALASIIFGAWMMSGGDRGWKVASATVLSYQERAARPSADENWALPPTPRNLLAGGLQSALAMTGNLLQNARLRLRTLAPLLIIPVALLAAVWRAYVSRGVSSSVLLLLGALSASTLVFSTILALGSGLIISFQPTYTNFAVPYLMILLAIGIAQITSVQRLARYLLTGFVLAQMSILLISLKLVYDDSPLFRPPNVWRATAEQIARTSRPGDVIVYASWHDARLHNLYLPPKAAIFQRVEPDLSPGKIEVIRNHSTRFELGAAPGETSKSPDFRF